MRFTILLLCCFFIFLLDATAQFDFNSDFDKKKDSAVAALKKYPAADTFRVNALVKIFEGAMFLKQKKEVLPYCDEALSISRKLNFQRAFLYCLSWKGNYYKSLKSYDTAVVYFDSVIVGSAGSKALEIQQLNAFTYLKKGMVLETQENYYKALDNYFKSLAFYDQYPDANAQTVGLMIATLYKKLLNNNKAIEYYKLADKYSKQVAPQQWSAGGTQMELANIYWTINKTDSVKYYLNLVKPKMPDTFQLSVTNGYYRLWGDIFFKEKQYDSAFANFDKALLYAGKIMHADYTTDIYNELALNEFERGHINEAGRYAMLNLEGARKSGLKSKLVPALRNVALYYSKTGNNAMAFELLTEAVEANDSLLTETSIKYANTLAATFESNKKESEIKELQTIQQLNEKEIRQQSLLNKIFFAAVALLFLLAFVAYRNYRNKQQLLKQTAQLQQAQITQLQNEKQLMAVDAMLKGQEEERSRIAKDLHDGLGGLLSGTKLSFMNIKENMVLTPENSALFDKSLRMLDTTIADLRKVAHNLMPEALVKFGLTEAVRDFCDSIHTASGLQVQYQQLGESRPISNTAAVFTYRIIQELVNNAAKHAAAKNLLVQLTVSPEKIIIAVEDDGKGFDKNALLQSKGAGMENINYRVQYFNGTMDIVTSPGNGTSVNIELKA